jgi:acetoin utilization deacetylase AcuC-like enzyme
VVSRAQSDAEYLAILDEWIPSLLERHEPKLVFFQAGVDALQEDSFGRLGMTRDGMMERNLRVYQCALAAGPRPLC